MASSGTFTNNIIGQLEQYRDSEGVFNIPHDGTNTGTEILRNIVDTAERPKRPASGYFLWLGDNRQKIKDTYFSDYPQIEDWGLESKKKYYEDKGLEWKEKYTDGKPKIVALVTSKAGIMWKNLDDSDKQEYLDRSQIIKDEYSQKIKQFNDINKSESASKSPKVSKKATKETNATDESKPNKKKGRGRPKKVVEEVNVVTDVMVEETVEQNTLDVSEEIVNGKSYYLDESSGVLYDPKTEAIVGEKMSDGTYTWN